MLDGVCPELADLLFVVVCLTSSLCLTVGPCDGFQVLFEEGCVQLPLEVCSALGQGRVSVETFVSLVTAVSLSLIVACGSQPPSL